MTVKGDVPTVDLDDCCYQRGTIQIRTPVLVKHCRRLIAQIANSLPYGHAAFLVLTLDVLDACGDVGALLQLPARLHGLLIGPRFRCNLPRHPELFLIFSSEGIVQCRCEVGAAFFCHNSYDPNITQGAYWRACAITQESAPVASHGEQA